MVFNLAFKMWQGFRYLHSFINNIFFISTSQRFGPEFLGIPGFFRVLGWWYAVYFAVLYGVYFALFSYLVPSVSNLSVWHIINKSSKNCGCAPHSRWLWQKIEPISESLLQMNRSLKLELLYQFSPIHNRNVGNNNCITIRSKSIHQIP